MRKIAFGIRRGAALLLLLGLVCGAGMALANESGQLLTMEDLRELQPAYEVFLNQLADVVIERGLISPEEREDWLMYQLGDYFQNGGYGMIAAMFNPGLLADARPQDSLLRLEKEFSAGVLHVDTMRAYSPLDATLPGLLLEASLTSAEGLPLECRIRWSCGQGGFATWDAMEGRVVEVGLEYVNDGRPFYWSDQPLTDDGAGANRRITLEVLAAESDTVLGKAEISLTPSGSGWSLDESALQ